MDAQGAVWYTGNGNATIGKLDPATGKVSSFNAPSGGDPHTPLTGLLTASMSLPLSAPPRCTRLYTTDTRLAERSRLQHSLKKSLTRDSAGCVSWTR